MHPSEPHDFEELRAVSAELGRDPLLIQAAGGNTSVKEGSVMWIKASGTRLADAETGDIFVPVDLEAMRTALASDMARADRPAEFALGDTALRPSIETSLHAAFEQRVVLHVHCVNTIALAIRADAKAALADRLGSGWAMIPYSKPGARLARQVVSVLEPGIDAVILGNHGLIVAGDTVAAAHERLRRVVAALSADPGDSRPVDRAALERLAEGSGYRPAAFAEAHQTAMTPWRVSAATRGVLYPDHVVFCGLDVVELRDGEAPDRAAAAHARKGRPEPGIIVAPGQGILVRRDASDSTEALARCLADVLRRVPEDSELVYMTETEAQELTHWDAEKYRRSLDAG